MNERQISRNPGAVEVRLHCLDMAVRSAALSGRADNLMALAGQYYSWVTEPQATKAEPEEPPRPASPPEAVDLGAGGTPVPGTVPSLRQAAGKS